MENFTIIEELGEGSYGKIFKAECLNDMKINLEINHINSIDLTDCIGNNLEQFRAFFTNTYPNKENKFKLSKNLYKGEIVALKQIKNEMITDEGSYQDISRELKLTLSLNNQHIIKIYNFNFSFMKSSNS